MSLPMRSDTGPATWCSLSLVVRGDSQRRLETGLPRCRFQAAAQLAARRHLVENLEEPVDAGRLDVLRDPLLSAGLVRLADRRA